MTREIPTDPYLLAARTASYRGEALAALQARQELADQARARVRALLELLDEGDRDLIRLLVLERTGQRAVGRLLGVSQPSVRRRLVRALRRLRFLALRPPYSVEALCGDAQLHVAGPAQLAAVLEVAQYGSIARASLQLGRSPHDVRRLLVAVLRRGALLPSHLELLGYLVRHEPVKLRWVRWGTSSAPENRSRRKG